MSLARNATARQSPNQTNGYERHQPVQVTPAKRGKQPDKPEGLDTDWCNKSPAERHRAMTGFCPCKTGIHAFHGNNLDATPQESLQHRHRSLRTLWRSGQSDSQY